MYKLPESWKLKKLVELGSIETGNTPLTSNPENYGGDLPFVGPSDLGNKRWIDTSSAKLTHKGKLLARLAHKDDILVSCIGILGKAGQLKEESAFNQQINAIRPNNNVTPGYLYYASSSLSVQMNRVAGIQVIPIVNKSLFSQLEIPCPPIEEQEKITQILDTLDTTIRQTEAIIAKLQQVKQGLLHDLLTRGIDANGQLRPPVEQAPHLYKESPLGWIPREWDVGPLLYCVASLDAGVSVNAEDRPHGSSEIGVLKTSAISNGVFYPEQNKAVVAREIRLVREPVQADSILVSRMNTPLLVGESCYVDVDSPNLFLPDRIWQLKIRESSIVQTKWLSYIFRTSHYRAYVEIHATGTSGSMKNLPKSRLLDMPVAFPKFREQVQTSNRMTVIDQRINAERANLRKLINEKSALMDDLLTGRVRVTALLSGQTPASKELERESA